MGWKVTATKLFCDIVKQWVTILVYHDGTTKCGYYERHPRESQCLERCTVVDAYKEDVFQREARAE
jgi:hypothetical protein